MVTFIGYLVVSVYCFALIYVTAYCLSQLYLLYHYGRHHSGSKHTTETSEMSVYPVVTIQLPLYNEPYVAERLIDSVCAIDYPGPRLDIQIIDDSNDQTSDVVARKVSEYMQKGYRIRAIRRDQRTGYKAGALDHGLGLAEGDFVAIFDADFVPKPGFLKALLPHFDDKTGVVQSRWEHLNEDYSLLTRLQAFQLNVHFTIEQTGRQAANMPLQFNGTAGIWRRQAIEDAGGWQSDTLTEDLDLSYRAQLKGWKIRYLEEIGSPAELPIYMPALKSQQFRWMKGGAETARKILPRLWRSELPFMHKVFASQHLLSSTNFIGLFLIGILSVPLLWLAPVIDLDLRYFVVFTVGLGAMGILLYVANARTSWLGMSVAGKVGRFLLYLPAFLSMSMGLSLHNSVAVLEGFAGKKTPFVRTPKYGISRPHTPLSRIGKTALSVSGTTMFEGLLAIYFLAAVILEIVLRDNLFIVFHLLLMFGYGAICYYTIRHSRMA